MAHNNRGTIYISITMVYCAYLRTTPWKCIGKWKQSSTHS